MGGMHQGFEASIYIGDVAIDSDGLEHILYRFPRAVHIDSIYIGVDTACTKADTNYNTFNFKNGTTTIAAIANGPNSSAGTTFAAGTPVICSTMTGGDVAAGDVLTLEPTKTGNGLALSGVSVMIVGRYIS